MAGTMKLFEDLAAAEEQRHPLSPRLFQATGVRVNPQVEWVEIQVKSVLNRVQGMPFKWSVNPYRGCQHACVFCAGPETPVLMGDGTHKPISELRPGDTIYGSVRDGFYRRYIRTTVMAQWFTRKRAFRILLEDGTAIVASGDHRLLSERGWKYVSGTEQGQSRRPFLTVNNKLMGMGRFVPQPRQNSDYMRGYLTGLIRGDGTVGSYPYGRPGHRHGLIHQFRLALTDAEALSRAEFYLREYDVPTTAFLFSKATEQHRAIKAIRAQSRPLVDAVRLLIDWPSAPLVDWWKGFLAGIFDAEGCQDHGIIRIANTDEVILDHVRRGLTQFGFNHVTEVHTRSRQGRLKYVRIRGGLPETIRFFHTVDPAISRKRSIEGRAVKSSASLRVVSIEPLPSDVELVDITTGTGDFVANGVVSHNCYARRTHWFLDQDGVNDWSRRIYAKVNAPEVLRRELAHPSWTRETVHIGTATDPYQPAEGAYHLTRQILEALRDFRTPANIVTRSTMVVRDRDILRQMAAGAGAVVCFSIATMDPALAREIEPDVPPPQRRLDALHDLAQAGIPTGVLLAPVLPGITDHPDQLAAVVEAAKAHGASSLWTNALHLGDVTRQAFFEYLEHRRPDLVPEYAQLYRGKYAPSGYRRRIQEVVAALKARSGFAATPAGARSDQPPRPGRVPEQLSLL